MNEKSKALRRALLCALLLAVLAASVFGPGKTLSWTTQNRATGMRFPAQIQLPDNGLVASLESFPVTDIAEGLFHFSTEDNSAKLPDHDPEGVGYNPYKRALVLKLTIVSLASPQPLAVMLCSAVEGSQRLAEWTYLSNAIQVTGAVLQSSGVVARREAPVSLLAQEQDNVWQALAGQPLPLYTAEGVAVEEAPVRAGDAFYFIVEYNQSFADHLRTSYIGPPVPRISYQNDVFFSLLLESGSLPEGSAGGESSE